LEKGHAFSCIRFFLAIISTEVRNTLVLDKIKFVVTMMRNILALLFMVSLATADVISIPGDDVTCPTFSCCEEDCCGPGTSYLETRCISSPSSPGFGGSYSDAYVPGCVPRQCCEANCCSEGTVFDADVGRCVSDGTEDPTSSPTQEPTSNMPVCEVDIIDPKACLCNEDDKKYTFEAKGKPPGGTYAWTLTAPNGEAVIVGAANQAKVVVDPVKLSTAADDVTLKVVYTPPNLDPCEKEVKFTVVKATLSFTNGNKWTQPENDITPDPTTGDPNLGAHTPGNPAGTTGWYKNIEIEATIAPCVDLPRCDFNWQSEKLGYSGRISPAPANIFTPLSSAPPNGGWLPDHPNDNAATDEKLEVAEKCKLYMVDNPGLKIGQNCQMREENWVLFNHKNYRSWLNINDMQCTDKLVWRASTRIICKKTGPNTYQWMLDNPAPTSNDVGLGGFNPLFVPPGARRSLEELLIEEADVPDASWLSAVVDLQDKM
jgi:hypothetical protein